FLDQIPFIGWIDMRRRMEPRTMDHLAHLDMTGSLWRRFGVILAWQERAQIGDDEIRALAAKRIGLVPTVDAYHQPEASGMPGFDAGQCIFDHDRSLGLDRQAFRRFQERVGGRLSRKAKPINFMAVDANLEQRRQSDG